MRQAKKFRYVRRVLVRSLARVGAPEIGIYDALLLHSGAAVRRDSAAAAAAASFASLVFAAVCGVCSLLRHNGA